MNEQEKKVTELLAQTWNEFIKLPSYHPDEQNDFMDAMHDAQRIIMSRVAVRSNPEIFGDHSGKSPIKLPIGDTNKPHLV